jgi:hypothetical protein
MARTIVIIFAAVVAVAIAVYVGTLIFAKRTKDLSVILQKYSFTALNPPSTLAPPGSLVTIIQDDPLVIGVICPGSESFGEHLREKLMSSESAMSEEARELTGQFKLDAANQQRLTADVGSQYVKSISVTLSNVRVIEIPDNVVFELIAQRKKSCQDAIEFRKKNGVKISVIKSVLQANALYKIDFDSSLDASAKLKIAHGIASTLGLTLGDKSEDTIKGDGLFWGVRDDASLATVSAITPPPTGAPARQRMLPVGKAAKVTSDAH